ncbi:MAG: hypothetical protein JRG96_03790 [Deltaproteobacteria bacterium]|nr:hypothetical protein [Deltaproteobacteria bacterium]
MRSSFDLTRSVLAAALLASLASAGCASSKHSAHPPDDLAAELATAPDWVRTNCNSYWDDGGATKICGVGSFRGTRNIALARTTAVARGRTEMARTLEITIETMLEDHPPSKGKGKEQIEVVSRQITDFTLSGSEMQDTWISDYGTLFALVALDLANFQDSLSQMGNLPEELRQTVQERAPRAFSELDRQTEP